MNTSIKSLCGLSFVLLLAIAAGCSSSSSDGGLVSLDSGSGIDLNGVWDFVGSSSSPPMIVSCTGGLGGAGTMLRESFTVNLDQQGSLFSGYTVVPCSNADTASSIGGAANGSIDGLSANSGQIARCIPHDVSVEGAIQTGVIDGMIVDDDGSAAMRTEFVATLSGSTLTVNVQTLTQDGAAGSCAVSGTYLATR